MGKNSNYRFKNLDKMLHFEHFSLQNSYVRVAFSEKKTRLEDDFLIIALTFEKLRKPIPKFNRVQLNSGFKIVASIHVNSCFNYQYEVTNSCYYKP